MTGTDFVPPPAGASDNPSSRKRSIPAPERYDLPGGYSAVRRGSWSWVIHLRGEPLRLPCGDLVAIDGDGEEVRAFLATVGARATGGDRG